VMINDCMSWSSNAEVDLPGDASSDEDDCNDNDEAAGDSSEECDENGRTGSRW